MGGEGLAEPERAVAPRVLLAVTGGVAAYKACELVRLLVRGGIPVQVALTPDAERFVGAELMAALSHRPALRDGAALDGSYPHLDAARSAAVVCVAPCTANTLAKLALGLADNVVTQSALAAAGALVVAPAMNVRMWRHPATERNASLLRERGAVLVGPEAGALAEGETGEGRMSEPAVIMATLLPLLGGGSLRGRRVLVTAGGTREPLDAVRFVGNRSSGRMGVALADAAAARGAQVTTLLANAVVRPGAGEVVDVESTAELEREVRARAAGADIILMAAAVGDYRPVERVDGKRPRRDHWTLELEPTGDILAGLAQGRRSGQLLIGFAAETTDGLGRARAKLDRKGVDLIVLNDVSRTDIGFDAPHNEVTLVGADGDERLAKAPKAVIAAAILDRVERMLPPA